VSTQSSVGGSPPPGRTYSLQDFVTWTAPGTDLPGQPMTGTQAQCQSACDANNSCVGFSWAKNANTNSAENCWLKQNIGNKSYGQLYHTYVKN
jgi:hypothetical protein